MINIIINNHNHKTQLIYLKIMLKLALSFGTLLFCANFAQSSIFSFSTDECASSFIAEGGRCGMNFTIKMGTNQNVQRAPVLAGGSASSSSSSVTACCREWQKFQCLKAAGDNKTVPACSRDFKKATVLIEDTIRQTFCLDGTFNCRTENAAFALVQIDSHLVYFIAICFAVLFLL